MRGDELANAACSCCACVNGCLDSADVAADHNGHEAAANLNLTDQTDVCCLDHRISRFDRADKTFCFNHTKSLFRFHDNFLLKVM